MLVRPHSNSYRKRLNGYESAKTAIRTHSVSCCGGFSTTFERVSGQKYEKADSAIYEKLNRFGNEKHAIEIARQKYTEHLRNGKNKPSEMSPGTTMHFLVGEIKEKIESKGE